VSDARRRFALAEHAGLSLIVRSQAHAYRVSVFSLNHDTKQSPSYCAASVCRESFRKFGDHIGAPSRKCKLSGPLSKDISFILAT
jgi:hypothetical protein